jgi:hypothetical protein
LQLANGAGSAALACSRRLIQYGPRVVRRFIRPALSLVVMIALLCAIVFQGRRFLWCPIMLEARQACCCPRTDHQEPGPAVERPRCCESKSVPASSEASVSSERMSPVALPVAFDPPAIVGEAPLRIAVDELACSASRPCGRVSPPPRGPPHALNCVYLI